jgi:hypothetical protein
MTNCDVPGSDRDASTSGCDMSSSDDASMPNRNVTTFGDASIPNRDMTSSDDASMPNRNATGHPDISTTECGGFDGWTVKVGSNPAGSITIAFVPFWTRAIIPNATSTAAIDALLTAVPPLLHLTF